jgi:hypothetical protein
MSSQNNEPDIVKALLDARVVDFAALGRVIAELGPLLAPCDRNSMCAFVAGFIQISRLTLPPLPLEDLAELGKAARKPAPEQP